MALPRFNASLRAVTSEVAPATRSGTTLNINKATVHKVAYRCQFRLSLLLQPQEDISPRKTGLCLVALGHLLPRA